MKDFGWLALVALVACTEPQGLESMTSSAVPRHAARGRFDVDPKAERDGLRAADLAHAAAAASLPAGFLSALTNDAVFLFPNAPWVQGAAAIEALLTTPPAPFVPGMSLSWAPVFVDVSVDGQVGYSFGNAVIQRPGLTPLRGQYISFWRKQDDGGWRVEAWNMSPAFAPPGETPRDFGHGLLDNGRGPFTPVDRPAEASALLAVDAAFSQTSVEQGERVAFGAFADQHAILLAGGNPDYIIGRAAIAASRPAPGERVLSWIPRRSAVGPLGDLGWTIGEFTSVAPEGAPFHGKYLSVWRKRPNGEWRFVQDAGSGNPPPVDGRR
jgi:ketosteroid isomerase-like protein